MTKAFVMLNADRVEMGELRELAGAVQQEIRLHMEGQCVCTLLVTYSSNSEEAQRFYANRTLDSMPAMRSNSIVSETGARSVSGA